MINAAFITVPALLTMLIGLGIPALVAFITKESLSAGWKAIILTFLSAVSGVLTAVLPNVPNTVKGWEQVVFNVLITFVLAVAADHGWYKPTGTTAAIHRKTEPFGIGPATPAAEPPPPH